MGELRLRQPQSRVVPLVDGPGLTRKQTHGLTEVGALARSKESGNFNIVANSDGFGDFLLPKLLHQFLNRLH